MRVILVIVGGTIGVILGLFLNSQKPQTQIVQILSPNDYCRSVGYDYAIIQDVTEAETFAPSISRVKCGYSRNDPQGRNMKGFAWYQYPPKTDLENYCNGDLEQSKTVLIP